MKKQIVNDPKTITVKGVSYPVVHSYTEALKNVKEGKTVAMYESGDSMYPILCNMEYGLMTPLSEDNQLKVGDAAFCRIPVPETQQHLWDGMMTHRVIDKVEIEDEEPYYLIGSTSGEVYGWTQEVFAKVLTTRIFQESAYYGDTAD